MIGSINTLLPQAPRILLLRGGALGDFILTIPAIRLLRSQWPAAQIELVGNARAAELALRDGLLTAVHSQHEARWATLFRPEPLPAALRNWLAGFDLILCAWPDPDRQIARHLEGLGSCRLFGAAQPAVAPAARHFCELLAPLGLKTNDYCARLDFPGRSQRLSPANTISCHPGSGSPRRNWPIDRWRELCGLLCRSHTLLIVGGEADAATYASLAPWGETAFQLPLPELATRLAACRLHIGHDTGITHLAAAVGTPCLALFGPSDPSLWAPQGNHVRVLQRGSRMEDLQVVEVFAEIERLLDSSAAPIVRDWS